MEIKNIFSKRIDFSNKRIQKIFAKQNSWICIASILIGLPTGYYLTSYLFKDCLDENYDFGIHIELWTYLAATLGTYLVSFIVSHYLSKKINTIDMVISLKANE